MIEEIKQLIKSREQLAQQAFEQYQIMVADIITSQTKNVNHISRTLDNMLDFCFDDNMLKLYRKLCRYMWDIDQETTAFYINAYREMWDEEGVKFGKNFK